MFVFVFTCWQCAEFFVEGFVSTIIPIGRTVLRHTKIIYNALPPLPTCIRQRFRKMMSCATPKRRKIRSDKRKQLSKKIYVRRKQGPRILIKRCRHRLTSLKAFPTKIEDKFTVAKDHSYDTDSFLVGIDDHASYSMINSMADYVDKPRRVRVRVTGIAGRLLSAHIGTV